MAGSKGSSAAQGPATADEVLAHLRSIGREVNRQGMARFGINTANALGISVVELRKIARRYRRNHRLALDLWKSGVHEARILASIIDDPRQVTERQADAWVRAFDSWDVCDQCCSNLFSRTGFGSAKAMEWSCRDEEFVKRAGFVLMAALAVHDRKAPDEQFLPFLQRIREESSDNRNFVRKAVNWALRQIGKRNPFLHAAATATAREIAAIDSKAARWIAADALRELAGVPGRKAWDAVQASDA